MKGGILSCFSLGYVSTFFFFFFVDQRECVDCSLPY
jgi:hypothetical protein